MARKRAASESGSEDEDKPSDGGGSDYEPDEPVKVNCTKCVCEPMSGQWPSSFFFILGSVNVNVVREIG